MHITALQEYGLRSALQLAKAFDQNQALQASVLAEREGLSLEYASKLMRLFRQAGLVRSVRGAQGGFILVKNPSSVSVKEVFDALASKRSQGPSSEVFCQNHSGQMTSCVHNMSCQLKGFWHLLDRAILSVTAQHSLQDLLGFDQRQKVFAVEFENQKNKVFT